MKVLFKWEHCFRFPNDPTAYYLEIPKSEITPKILSLLEKDTDCIKLDDQYFEDVKNFANGEITRGLANEDCAYILVDKDVTAAIVCSVYYPYSGQWGAECPFEYLFKKDMDICDYLKIVIDIQDIDDIKQLCNISELS